MTTATRALEPVKNLGQATRIARMKPGLAQLLVAIALSGLGGIAIATLGDPVLVGGLLAGAGFVAIGMVAPALFLSILLLIRPMLDDPFGGTVGSVPSANAAGIVAVLLVVVTAIVIARNPRLVDVRVTLAIGAVLAVSALAGTQAFLEFGGQIGIEPLDEMARLAALLAIYLLAGHAFGNEQGVRRLFLLVSLSAAAPVAIGLAELAQGPEPVAGYSIGRISSTFVGPLPLSAFLAIAALVLTQMPRDLLDSRLRMLLLAGALIALVATFSREGWLMFLVGFAILEWSRRRGLLFAALGICALLVVAIPEVRERTLPFASDTSGRTADDSFDWRVANWRGLLGEYGERPFTGWGLMSTGYVNPRAPVTASGPGGGFDAHNTAVRALVEGGPLLLAAYVGVFATILVAVRQMARRREWPLHPFARTLLAIWIAITIVAVVSDDPFEATTTMYILLALTGAMQAAYISWRRNPLPSQSEG